MKKLFVILVAITLGLTTAVSAKKLPVEASKLPADFKQAVANHLQYPKFAQDNLLEGEVWMTVTLDENSMVKIVELSATNPVLGEYVQTELADLSIQKSKAKAGTIYYMKVKFNLTDL